MKAKYILLAGCILITSIIFSACSNTKNANSNNQTDTVNVKSMMDTHTFVFIPRYVTPMTGRRKDLSGGFEISVSKDTIISYLPFLGRGYTAPVSPSDVDFDFTSTNFTYTATASKKGWIISVKPKDKMNVQELYFRIFDNANASLTITSIDRTSISYDGYITERKTYLKPKK